MTPLPSLSVPLCSQPLEELVWQRLGSLPSPPALAGAPNTPGNAAGSLPPGTAGSRRLPGWTRADPCRRAEQSPAGQKPAVERIPGNEPMQAHTSFLLLVSAPSFTGYPCLPMCHLHHLTVPLPCPVPPRPEVPTHSCQLLLQSCICLEDAAGSTTLNY